MRTESEQLTRCIREKIQLSKETLELENEINKLLDNRPKRDFQYFVYGCLMVSVIVALVCWGSGG